MESVTSSRATKSPNRLVIPEMSMLMSRSLLLGLGRSLRLFGAEDGHDDQARDADEREKEGSSVGGPLLKVLILRFHDQGCGLSATGDVSGQHLDGPELPEGPGEGQDHAVNDGPLDAGQGDPEEGLPGVGPEAPG